MPTSRKTSVKKTPGKTVATKTNRNGGPAPVPDAHLLYTTVRLHLYPLNRGALQMNILLGEYRGVALVTPEGGVPVGMISAREMMPANGPRGVLFDMNQGEQNLVEVYVQGVRGNPGTPFLRLEFTASGGPFIIRIFVPGYVGDQRELHAGRNLYYTYLISPVQITSTP